MRKLVRRVVSAAYSHGQDDQRPDMSDRFYAVAHDKSRAAEDALLAQLTTLQQQHEALARFAQLSLALTRELDGQAVSAILMSALAASGLVDEERQVVGTWDQQQESEP